MAERDKVERRQDNRFNYSTELQGNNNSLNLHHKYFRMYEQFAAQATDRSPFEEEKKQDKKSRSFCVETVEKDRTVVRSLQVENSSLRAQLKESQQMVQKLKAELHRSNLQVQRLTKTAKIQSYQYQSAIQTLQEEIYIVLEQNKNCDEECRTLKQIIREMNEQQIKSSFEMSQLRMYSRSKSLGRPYSQCSHNDKQNQYDSNRPKENKPEKEEDSNRKFITGVKEMYYKIMNLKAVSMKQLWRWLKGIGQMLHRLKKWRKGCREFLKEPTNKTYENVVDFLNQAMIIID